MTTETTANKNNDLYSDHENGITEKVRVIIVGAGIAGIAAATYLSQNGENNFRILEARDRIGGRILTVSSDGGKQLDLGAGWIHGILGNPVYELALDGGLVHLAEERELHAVVALTEEGKRIPIAVVDEVYDAYFWFSKRCQEYFPLRMPCPGVDSVGAHLQRDIDAYLQQFHDPKERNMRRLVFDHLMNRETCITGTDSLYETGLSDFGSYAELPGGNVTIPAGFSLLLDLLLQKVPSESILTGHCVQQILWKNDHSAKIICTNGRLFFADHVLVTIPLGVLKECACDMFDPPLPDYKLECIQRLSFGVVNKIYLEYERPFLSPDLSEILVLWNDSSGLDPDNSWCRKIYSFSQTKDNILLAWISGKEAEFVEKLSDDEVANTCTTLLRKFLSDPYVPKPRKIIRSNWKNQQYSRGSYTSIGVGSSQEDIELLAKPIYSSPYQNKPVLLFAGEATHTTFYSTVHGAYLSGLRACRLLLGMDDDSADEKSLSSWLRGIDLS